MAEKIQEIQEMHKMLKQLPGIVCIKDENSVFVASSELAATRIGFKNSDDIIGKTDRDIKNSAIDMYEEIIEDDQYCLRNGKSEYLYISKYDTEKLKVMHCYKTRIIVDEKPYIHIHVYDATEESRYSEDITDEMLRVLVNDDVKAISLNK